MPDEKNIEFYSNENDNGVYWYYSEEESDSSDLEENLVPSTEVPSCDKQKIINKKVQLFKSQLSDDAISIKGNPLWIWFKKIDELTATCLLCNEVICMGEQSFQTVLGNHLKRLHEEDGSFYQYDEIARYKQLLQSKDSSYETNFDTSLVLSLNMKNRIPIFKQRFDLFTQRPNFQFESASWVWYSRCYTRCDTRNDKTSQCLLCGRIYSCNDGTTSVLLIHIKRKHNITEDGYNAFKQLQILNKLKLQRKKESAGKRSKTTKTPLLWKITLKNIPNVWNEEALSKNEFVAIEAAGDIRYDKQYFLRKTNQYFQDSTCMKKPADIWFGHIDEDNKRICLLCRNQIDIVSKEKNLLSEHLSLFHGNSSKYDAHRIYNKLISLKKQRVKANEGITKPNDSEDSDTCGLNDANHLEHHAETNDANHVEHHAETNKGSEDLDAFTEDVEDIEDESMCLKEEAEAYSNSEFDDFSKDDYPIYDECIEQPAPYLNSDAIMDLELHRHSYSNVEVGEDINNFGENFNVDTMIQNLKLKEMELEFIMKEKEYLQALLLTEKKAKEDLESRTNTLHMLNASLIAQVKDLLKELNGSNEETDSGIH